MGTIRAIRGDDKEALTRFHARLSEESRYRRYHGVKGNLTKGDLRHLTEVDGIDHVACVAVDAEGEIDAVGRIVADPRGGHAELAVVVADDRRGRGLGAAVVRSALSAFYSHGHAGPVLALVQGDNHHALQMLTGIGGQTERAGAAVVLAFPARAA